MECKVPLFLFLLINVGSFACCEKTNVFGFPVDENMIDSDVEQFELDESSTQGKNLDKRVSYFEDTGDTPPQNSQDQFEGSQENSELISGKMYNQSGAENEREPTGKFPDAFNLNDRDPTGFPNGFRVNNGRQPTISRWASTISNGFNFNNDRDLTGRFQDGFNFNNRDSIGRFPDRFNFNNERQLISRFPDRFNMNNERNKSDGQGFDDDVVRSPQIFKDSVVIYDRDKMDETPNFNMFSGFRNDNDYQRRVPINIMNNENKQNFRKYDFKGQRQYFNKQKQNFNNYNMYEERQTFNNDQLNYDFNYSDNQDLNDYDKVDTMSDVNSRYRINSGRNYNSGSRGHFKNSKIQKNDKGVVINFNTDCAQPQLLTNTQQLLPPNLVPESHHIMHNIFYTTKPYTSPQPDVSCIQTPGYNFVAPNEMNEPMYYV